MDCGEGTQIKMVQFKVKSRRISHIFITHLHGDHIFGLPGLLNSLSLNGRQEPLKIFGPEGIANYVRFNQKQSSAHFTFDIDFQELKGAGPIDLGTYCGLQFKAFPLKHRIPTFGYKAIEVQAELNVDPEAITKYSLSIEEILNVKKGASIIRGDSFIPTELLVLPPRRNRSFAYCTDTIYDPDILQYIEEVSLLYHEATYTDDLAEKARERMHSTTKDAAQIAKSARAKQLVIGHYSNRYKNLNTLLQEAKVVFQNTMIAEEGKLFQIL